MSGNAAQFAQMQKEFTHLSGQTSDLSFYTSDGQGISQEKLQISATGMQPEIAVHVSVLVPEIAVEGFSRGR